MMFFLSSGAKVKACYKEEVTGLNQQKEDVTTHENPQNHSFSSHNEHMHG